MWINWKKGIQFIVPDLNNTFPCIFRVTFLLTWHRFKFPTMKCFVYIFFELMKITVIIIIIIVLKLRRLLRNRVCSSPAAHNAETKQDVSYWSTLFVEVMSGADTGTLSPKWKRSSLFRQRRKLSLVFRRQLSVKVAMKASAELSSFRHMYSSRSDICRGTH